MLEFVLLSARYITQNKEQQKKQENWSLERNLNVVRKQNMLILTSLLSIS